MFPQIVSKGAWPQKWKTQQSSRNDQKSYSLFLFHLCWFSTVTVDHDDIRYTIKQYMRMKEETFKKSKASSPGAEETRLLSWPSFQGTHYMKLDLLHCSRPGMHLISIRRRPQQQQERGATLLHESHGIESFSFCRLPSPKAGQTAVTERTPSGHLLHTL